MRIRFVSAGIFPTAYVSFHNATISHVSRDVKRKISADCKEAGRHDGCRRYIGRYQRISSRSAIRKVRFPPGFPGCRKRCPALFGESRAKKFALYMDKFKRKQPAYGKFPAPLLSGSGRTSRTETSRTAVQRLLQRGQEYSPR